MYNVLVNIIQRTLDVGLRSTKKSQKQVMLIHKLPFLMTPPLLYTPKSFNLITIPAVWRPFSRSSGHYDRSTEETCTIFTISFLPVLIYTEHCVPVEYGGTGLVVNFRTPHYILDHL